MVGEASILCCGEQIISFVAPQAKHNQSVALLITLCQIEAHLSSHTFRCMKAFCLVSQSQNLSLDY